ncbi:MAG: PBP1A family penicillin-binding protein [Alphaproteobacteria bacterium]|nr:PBP1A family penicillin-binding protein [Alphaproteobacteria bacterium]
MKAKTPAKVTKKNKQDKKGAKKKSPLKRRKSKHKSKSRNFWIKPLLITVLCLFLLLAGYVGYCFITMPDIGQAISRTRLPATTILSADGQEIESYGGVYSDVVYAQNLPQYVIDAVISTEDRRFYSHFGFDVIGFTRAMIVNIIHRRYVQGASTITQQVSKNLFLTPEKTIRRKVQELLMAFWLEKKFDKNRILTLYLNRVYMGAGTYGIEAASQKFFHKSSSDINMLEAAVLAGLLKAPARYNPVSNRKRALERAKVVLKNMVDAGKITSKQRDLALTMPLGNNKYNFDGGKYFADWVYNEVNAYIGERQSDTNVYTTLDLKIQKAAEEVLRSEIAANKDKNVTNGAVVVIADDGAVKALVGGIDYRKSQFNRAVQALRQPGSSFKTFVYLTALENGFAPSDIIEDKPLSRGRWMPKNYDKKYYGQVTLKTAFKRSLNLATLDLLSKISLSKVIKEAHRMGISTPIENSYAAALGASEVKVLDMAVAYSTISNGGFANWPYTISEIYTKDGYKIYERIADEKERIISPEAVENITSMLHEVIESGTGKKAQVPFFAAGKTGTSQDYRDAWFVGFGGGYTAAVWVGNDDNSPMKNIGGGGLPADIWQKIMSRIVK